MTVLCTFYLINRYEKVFYILHRAIVLYTMYLIILNVNVNQFLLSPNTYYMAFLKCTEELNRFICHK